jgi:hypothetical protein
VFPFVSLCSELRPDIQNRPASARRSSRDQHRVMNLTIGRAFLMGGGNVFGLALANDLQQSLQLPGRVIGPTCRGTPARVPELPEA